MTMSPILYVESSNYFDSTNIQLAQAKHILAVQGTGHEVPVSAIQELWVKPSGRFSLYQSLLVSGSLCSYTAPASACGVTWLSPSL